MIFRLFFFTLVSLHLLGSVNLTAAQPNPRESALEKSGSFHWENAIILIDLTGKTYNYYQPWLVRQREERKTGIVLPNHQILTTADGLSDNLGLRLQKQGSGPYSLGQLVWIDYNANLALITCKESDFWQGLQPAHLAPVDPLSGDVDILRWNDTNLENRKGVIERMQVVNGDLTSISVPSLHIVDTNIQGAGGGEALVSGHELLGLVNGEAGDTLDTIPSSFISFILKAREAKTYTGMGYFDFTWDPINNPLVSTYLALPGKNRGVIVKDTGLKPGVTSLIKHNDIITQIDDFPIDAEGNYLDPVYGKMSLENLSSREKWAGSICKMKLWRDGKELTLDYKLPLLEMSDDLVRYQNFDQPPAYVLTGGLVFIPLTNAYLRSWGQGWRTKSPFRLYYYNFAKVTPERTERVILTQVIPDPINIGYENARQLVVDRVNGIKIRDLAALAEALKSPINGFQVIDFDPGQSTSELVLPADQIEESNQRIRDKFHIQSDQVLDSNPTPPSGLLAPTAKL